MTEGRKIPDISSSGLHLLAMGLMLCDHMWAELFPAAEWLTCAGRLAFPIFAFLLAEGYAHTGNLRRYFLRLLVWAIAAEIPFDLMYAGTVFYPVHQNVLWTLLLSLALMALMDRCRARLRPVPAAAAVLGLALLGFLLGYAAMVDYYGEGVLMALVFHLFRGRSWKSRLLQFLCLFWLNAVRLGGYGYPVELLGWTVELPQQGLALLALVPIWLYRGRQGVKRPGFRRFCYAFYPGHMLLLWAVRTWLLR